MSPDAAPASTLFGGPILVSAPEGLSEATLAEINRLSPKEVVLIGGTAALSTNIETQLKSLQTPPQVSRWGGKNRQETAMIVAAGRAYHGGQNSHIYLARADRPWMRLPQGCCQTGFLYLPPNMPLTSGFTMPMAKQFNVWSVIPIGGIEGKGFVFLDESLLPRHHRRPHRNSQLSRNSQLRRIHPPRGDSSALYFPNLALPRLCRV
ncbi:cell wall-binding repeat-containing protein [Mobiluncus mulieris]|uniref:cell wall-binding repeat-containing protein n=1 Tax=Mobiluncus mulieris TaxID=2052 RepID=UPI00209212D5|nr:hypothetical protein [Mobiluncus mulieris]